MDDKDGQMTTSPAPPSAGEAKKLDAETLNAYTQILRSPTGADSLPVHQQTGLILLGVVVSLRMDGSEAAVTALTDCALGCSIQPARELALGSLEDLAVEENPAAIAALFGLATEQGYSPAAEIIRFRKLTMGDVPRDAVFALLYGEMERFRALDAGLVAISAGYLRAGSTDLRERLIKAAEKAGLQHWALIITAIESGESDKIDELVKRYPGFPPVERTLALEQLNRLAQEGHAAAMEAVCRLYVQYQDEAALRLAVENRYAPREPIERALFLFLSEQWQDFERYDFDQRLLTAAYETAGPELRKRILDLSRGSGQMEWFQGISGASRMRWLNDLSDADWGHAIQYLMRGGRWEDLWRLAQASAPVWSARILAELDVAGWKPGQKDEAVEFDRLAELSREAERNPLAIRPYRSFSVPTLLDDLTTLAISPDGSVLALGTSSNAIHIWRITDFPSALPVLHGAAAQVRALTFSPDGEYLAAACGDNSVRVFRWLEGREVKALKGHEGLVRSLAINPDGRALYTASFDGTLRAWRFPSGPEIKTLQRTDGEIFGVALNPEGSLLVSAGADRVVQVHQLPEGNLVREMSGHEATITNLVTAPTTPLAASYSRDRTIRVWNYVSGRAIQVIAGQREVVTGLCVHPNEQAVISAAYNGKITLWNISTGAAVAELAAHRKPVTGLVLNPEGSLLVSVSADAAVTIWNLEHFLLIRQPVENMPARQGERIQRQIEQAALLPNEKKWLAFTLELVRWKQRFDVEIEAPRRIEAGEFDIQL